MWVDVILDPDIFSSEVRSNFIAGVIISSTNQLFVYSTSVCFIRLFTLPFIRDLML